MLLNFRRFIMENEKVLEDLIARLEKLEKQMSEVTKAEAEVEAKVKKCLPGYNSCEI